MSKTSNIKLIIHYFQYLTLWCEFATIKRKCDWKTPNALLCASVHHLKISLHFISSSKCYWCSMSSWKLTRPYFYCKYPQRLLECCCLRAEPSRWLHCLPLSQPASAPETLFPLSQLWLAMMFVLIKILTELLISSYDFQPQAAPAASPGGALIVLDCVCFLFFFVFFSSLTVISGRQRPLRSGRFTCIFWSGWTSAAWLAREPVNHWFWGGNRPFARSNVSCHTPKKLRYTFNL